MLRQSSFSFIKGMHIRVAAIAGRISARHTARQEDYKNSSDKGRAEK